MRDLSDLQPSLRTSNIRWTRKEDLPRLMDQQDPSADLVSIIEQAGLRRAPRSLFDDRVVQWDLTPVEHYGVVLSADLSTVPGGQNRILRLTQDTFGFNTLDAYAAAGVYFPQRVPDSGRFYFLWHSNFDVPSSQGGSENVRFLNADDTTSALIGVDDDTGGFYEQTGGLFVSDNAPRTPRLIEIDVDNQTAHIVYLDVNGQPKRALAYEGDLTDTEIRLEVNRGENTDDDLLFVFSANAEAIPEPLSATNGFSAYPDPVQPRFPDQARPSELLRVVVAGTFDGVDFAVNEGAIVSNLYPQEVLPLKGPSGTVVGPDESEPRSIPIFETEYGNKLTKTQIKIDLDNALFGFSKKYITHTEANLVLDPSLNGCRIWATHQQGLDVVVPEDVAFQKGFHVEFIQTGGEITIDAQAVSLIGSRDPLKSTGVGTSVLLSHIDEGVWWGNGEGLEGLSAYQVALANGFEGSVSDWLEALRGQDGIGIRILGSLPSPSDLPLENNDNGDAYIIQQVMWVFDGATWVVASQAGPRGKSAYQVAQDSGFQGSVAQWLDSLKGESAYQTAKATGQIAPTVTEEEWLETLKGDSAFLVAKAEGFQGTRAEWLGTLKGEQGDEGPPGPKGDPTAAIRILGEADEEQDLPTDATEGDAYFIARNLWVWTGSVWFDAGEIVGPKGDVGDPGPKGDDGDSAYRVAQIEQGFAGTVHEWLNSLKGLSAYQVAVQQGVDLTPEEWLLSLNGQDGLDAFATAQKYGFEGDYNAWVESIRGPRGFQGLKGDQGVQGNKGDQGLRGYSNYEIAVQLGFEGDEADFLESQRGPKGDEGGLGPKGDEGPPGPMGRGLEIDGVADAFAQLPTDPVPADFTTYIVIADKHLYFWLDGQWNDAGEIVGPSVYQIAIEQGFEGNEQQWLDSLKGQSAYALAVANGFIGNETEWLDSLKGVKGDEGEPGLNAYELAQSEGFEGTLQEWFESQRGPKGDQGTGLVPKGPLNDQTDLPETAVNGWVYTIDTHIWMGVEGAWQDQGDFAGPEGLSAFQVAQLVDPSLVSEAEWVASLKGDQGDQGPPGPRGLSLNPLGELDHTDDLPDAGDVNDMYYIGGHAWIWIGAQWVDHGDLKGPPGPKGDQGAGVRILGAFDTPAELPPSANQPGDGYLIGENFYVWNGDNWQNVGPIKGPPGDTGSQGPRGLKGDAGDKGETGDKGEKGSVWVSLDRDPTVLDGRPNDYAINTSSHEYFLKTSDTNWASLGHLGGGNVYDVSPGTVPYLRVSGEWTAFDHYTLPVGAATDTLDLSSRNVFEIDASVDRVLSFANPPDSGTAMTIAITLLNGTGMVTWPESIDWTDDEPPTLGENYTIVVLFWTGSFWSGTVTVNK